MTRPRAGLAVGLVLAALALAFATGRWSARAPAVRDERTVATASKASAAVVARADDTKRETATKDVDTSEHSVIRWIPAMPAAGGCPAIPAHVEQETTRETHAASTHTADARRASNVAARQEQQAQATEITLHTVTPAPRPNWSVIGMVGAQIGGRHEIMPAPFVFGASLERRIVGPVSVGIWGLSSAAGGISVRVDF